MGHTTFLSARVISGDTFDLRSANVVIPCLEDSTNTQKENLKLNKDMLTVGFKDKWMTANQLNARPKEASGAAPDSDEKEDMTASKLHIPATSGQVVETDPSASAE